MNTALSEVLVFKLFRAETATGTVTSPPIVIALDIINYRRPYYFPTDKAFAVDAFDFPHKHYRWTDWTDPTPVDDPAL